MPVHLEDTKLPVRVGGELIVRPNNQKRGSSDNRLVLTPSMQACAELQYAYDYFNETLWAGKLPQAILTYTRRKNCYGYFAPNRFQNLDDTIASEISLNAMHLAARDDRESLGTLVHEMAHLWRHYLGPLNNKGGRGSNGYHDTIWAKEMLRVGLVPSSTGKPGGIQTGNRVSHYIEEDGLFDKACATLLDTGFQISWSDRIVRKNPSCNIEPGSQEIPSKKDRIKFSCVQSGCGLNAWAKPSARLLCGNCHAPMHPADTFAGVSS